jgi:ABC-type branched-subunit amino acid transport system ATPase component
LLGHAFAALELSGRGYVLKQGRMTLRGSDEGLLNDPEAKAACLAG